MPEDKETKTEKAEKKGVAVTCGHRNLHFTPSLKDGQPVQGDVLVCTLEKGHQPVRVPRFGPKGEDQSTYEIVHSAPYKTVKGGAVVDDVAYWMDTASQPNAKQRARAQ